MLRQKSDDIRHEGALFVVINAASDGQGFLPFFLRFLFRFLRRFFCFLFFGIFFCTNQEKSDYGKERTIHYDN